MRKEEEIAALDAFIEQLPRVTYLHQALRDARQMLIQQIRADYIPDIAAHLACRRAEAVRAADHAAALQQSLATRRQELEGIEAEIALAQRTAARLGSELFASYQRISTIRPAG